MRRKSLIFWKKFSIRWRHLYISRSYGLVPARLALGGMTASVPRSFSSALSQSLSKALSAINASRAMPQSNGATPTLSCRLARQQNEAHEIAERIDESHDLGRQTAARLANGLIFSPPFAPVPCRWTLMMVPSTSPYSKSGSLRQLFEHPLKDALERPPAEALPQRGPLAVQRRQVAPWRAGA